MRRVSNDAYVATMEAHLEMWGAPIDRIRQRAEKASGEGRIGYLAQADAANAMREEIAQQLHELLIADEERFTDLRSGIADAWRRFTSEVCRK
jgi:hypothetical protein